jgi:hypothetical protein
VGRGGVYNPAEGKIVAEVELSRGAGLYFDGRQVTTISEEWNVVYQAFGDLLH